MEQRGKDQKNKSNDTLIVNSEEPKNTGIKGTEIATPTDGHYLIQAVVAALKICSAKVIATIQHYIPTIIKKFSYIVHF